MKIQVAPVAARLGSRVFAVAGLALSFATVGCGGSGAGGGSDNSGGSGGSGGGGGGGGNSATCGVDPCGGDVVGNWKASSSCVDHATLSMDIVAGAMRSCPTVSLGAVSMIPSGTLSLAADMSFTGTLAVSTTFDINYPPACVNGATCAQATQTMQTIVGTNGITSVSCAGTGGCTCTTAQSIEIINATGTWATSGTTLTFAGAPGGDGPYCVQGSALHLVGYDLATMTRIVSDFVLTKQ